MAAIDNYIQAIDGPGPKKPAKVAKASTQPTGLDGYINALDQDKPSDTLLGGKALDYNPNEYDFNLKSNTDNNFLRAKNQSFGEQLGKTAANLIPNIITGIGEQVGYLGSLGTEWGDDRDYSNSLVETMKEMKNPFGESYRENPGDVWSMGDSAWWLNNGSQLIESVGSFAALGAGVGSLFAKAAGGLAKIGMATDIAAGLGQTATAATLAYSEGAMAGYDVYKKTYDTQYLRGIARGLSHEDADSTARHIGAQSAATTVQLNTVLGTALNFTAVAPMFADMKKSAEFFRSGAGARIAGETLEAYSTRLSTLGIENSAVKKLLAAHGKFKYGMEAGKEGFEEVLNQFTQRTGEDLGEQGKTKDYLAQFDELEHWFERTTDSEAALNFALGAIGGAGNTIALDVIPVHRRDKIGSDGETSPIMSNGEPVRDAKGNIKFEKKFYSGKFLAENQRYAYFENVKDAIQKDIKYTQDKTEELRNAVITGDLDKAADLKNDLLSAHHLNAVISGQTPNFTAEYEGYAALDNKVDLGAQAQEQADEFENQQAGILKGERVEDPTDLSEESLEMYNQLEEQKQQALAEAEELSGTTEAMQRGFATDQNDNAYVKKANEAIADLKKYDQWYTEVQGKLRWNSEAAAELNIPQMILGRRIDSDLRTKRLQDLGGEIEQLQTELDTQSVPLTTDQFNSTLNDFNNQVVKSNRVAQMFQDKINAMVTLLQEHDSMLQDGKIPNTDALVKLLADHRIDFNPDDLTSAVRNLSKKLTRLRDLKMQDATSAEEAIANSPQFGSWQAQHSGSLIDYLNWLRSQVAVNNDLISKQVAHEELSSRHQIAEQELQQIMADPGKFIRKVKNDIDKVKKATENIIQAENTVRERLNREHEQAARLERKQIDYTIKKLRKELTDKSTKLLEGQKEAEKRNLPQEGKLARIKRSLSKVERKLRSDIRDLTSQIEYLEFEIQRLGGELEIAQDKEEAAKDTDVVSEVLDEQEAEETDEELEQEPEPETIQPELTPTSEETATTRDDQNSGTTQRIDEILNSLTPIGKQLVEGIVNQQLDNGVVDWNSLNGLVLTRSITKPQATQLLSAVEDLINGVVEDTSEVIVPEEVEAPEEIIWPDPVEPDIPETTNESSYESSKRHEGEKTTTPLKVQRLDEHYVEVESEGAITLRSTGELNSKSDLDLLTDGSLDTSVRGNFAVRLELDTDYQDFENFTDSNGTVIPTDENLGEIPIKIIDVQNDRVLGYLPRMDWITSKNPDAENYRNIVTDADDEGDRVSPTIDEHKEKLLTARKRVISAYASSSEPVITNIREIGAGHFIQNRVRNTDGSYSTKPASATTMLPDASLQIALVTGFWQDILGDDGKPILKENGSPQRTIRPNTLTVSKGIEGAAAVDLTKIVGGESAVKSAIGQVKILAPMPNGKIGLVPLTIPNLNKEDVDTVIHVIETYLRNDKTKIAEYSKLTGFDLGTAEGLRRFLNQHYTYTQSFAEVELNPNNTKAQGSPFMFSITNEVGTSKRGLIKVGERASGNDAVFAKLDRKTGGLNSDFVDMLSRGLKSRPVSVVMDTKVPAQTVDTVGLVQGINNPKSYQRFIFNRLTGKLQAQGKPFKNYNAFIKEISTTTVNGTNKSPNGKYVYGVHPNIELEDNFSQTPAVESSSAPEAAPAVQDEIEDEEFDFLGSLNDENTISSESLQDLSDATPQENHNGKSVEDVLYELKGLYSLPEDFNPFRKC